MWKKIDDVQIHMDYMSFTIPLESQIDVKIAFEELQEELANLFYMTSINYGQISDWAHDGYQYQLSLGENIIIRFGGDRNAMKKIIDWDDRIKSDDKYDSLMVELKGQACREIEFLSDGTIDYLNIISWVEKHGGKFTRIDIAIDDMKGNVIKLSKILDLVAKGLYTSSFRSVPFLNDSALRKNNYKDIDVDEEPCSLYFGKNTSDKQLCIYNKKAERKNKNDSWDGEYWTRFEMRFRHDAADNLAYFMMKNNLNNIGKFSCEQLKNLFILKYPYYNGKKSEMKDVRKLDVYPPWEKFLNCVKGTSFSLRPVLESTIETKVSWRTYSLSRMDIILEIANAYEDDDWVFSGAGKIYKEKLDKLNYLKEKRDRITGKDIAMINNYRRKNWKSGLFYELTQSDIDEYMKQLEIEIKNFESKYRLPF